MQTHGIVCVCAFVTFWPGVAQSRLGQRCRLMVLVVINFEHIGFGTGISIGIDMSISIDDGMLREPVRSWYRS